ncbi:MAG: hypothetical protein DRJ50_09275 [Actinobacteria bacterium]|nr:MAG: hypothetical protein DRJ50_09275 [Actinomycetota bacterium]
MKRLGLAVAAILGLAACNGDSTSQTLETSAIPSATAEQDEDASNDDVSTASPASNPAAPMMTEGPSVGLDPAGGTDGPVMYWAEVDWDESESAEIVGRLDLAGDCLYVTAEWGRYPVLWQYGTRWQEDPAAVVLPDGVKVQLGAEILSGGGYHSSNQLSQFTESDDVAAAAERCADNEWKEVAVVQSPVDHRIENAYRSGE